MTARLDPTASDGHAAALSRVAPGDSPLATQLEPEPVRLGLDDSALRRMDAIPKEDHLSLRFDRPSVNDGKRRTAEVVKRIKRVFRALGTAPDFEQTVDSRLSTLRGLDQEIQNRAQAVSTSLGGDAAAWEAPKAIAEAMEQLERRAADTAVVVSELEGRILDLSGSQQLDRLENCVARLEQRTTSAAIELKHITDVRAALELEVLHLQNQLREMTKAAVSEVTRLTTAADETARRLGAARQEAERYQRAETQTAAAALAGLETRMAEIERTVAPGGAEKLTGLGRHAEDHAADRASHTSIHDLLNTLRFPGRGPNTWLVFSPARLIFGGAAFTLSGAIVLLVGIVWRTSPVENHRPERPRPAVVLARPALTPMPALALGPAKPLRADISHDRPEATPPARAVPALPVRLVVASVTPAASRGVPTAAAQHETVKKAAKTPQYVGTLLIESDPAGATAFVNHEPVGETPVRLKDLRAGSYVVRLEYEGYQRWSTAATVSAVRQERVKAKLELERSR